MAKLPSVGHRKVVKAFEWLGWREVRQSGGHIILTKEGSVATLSVPAHKSVSKGAGLEPQAYWKVKLMKSGNSQLPNEIKEDIRLLQDVAAGQLDGLLCPNCKKPCVSVWFTRPTSTDYRTWCVCENCGHKVSAQNTGRPPNYSESRDRTGREARGLLATDREK